MNLTPKYLIVHLANEHQNLNSKQRDILRKQLGLASGVAFVSKANQLTVERQIGDRINNACILRNPVNIKSMECISWPKSSSPVFCSVARLDVRFKGQDILFETLSSPPWNDRNWECRLYGEGPDMEHLKRLALHYGIKNRVSFLGHVEDIRQLWSEGHLLVMPSRSEGIPLALVEAMICGRPAVVTDAGGSVEWIHEGKTGFIAEAATAKSFGAAMERAWSARESWQELGRNAHQYSITHIDPNPGQTLLELLCSFSENTV
jgi:glycosyltransferase involved in cell wall biosynthesis